LLDTAQAVIGYQYMGRLVEMDYIEKFASAVPRKFLAVQKRIEKREEQRAK
jgi:hypothetical protein